MPHHPPFFPSEHLPLLKCSCSFTSLLIWFAAVMRRQSGGPQGVGTGSGCTVLILALHFTVWLWANCQTLGASVFSCKDGNNTCIACYCGLFKQPHCSTNESFPSCQEYRQLMAISYSEMDGLVQGHTPPGGIWHPLTTEEHRKM